MFIDFNCEWSDIRKQFDRCTGLIAEMIKDPKSKEDKEELQQKEALFCRILDLMTNLK